MTSRWSTCSTASRPGGVVIAGDLTISLAVVDLVHISLRALISPAEKLMQQRPSAGRIEMDPEAVGRDLGQLDADGDSR